jgi:hypothetical protein
MSREKLEDIAHWYVLRTNPRQEDRAASNLQAWGVKTLNPKFRQSCYDGRMGRLNNVIKCCFPGTSSLDSGSKTCFTRFVSCSPLLYSYSYIRSVRTTIRLDTTPAGLERFLDPRF